MPAAAAFSASLLDAKSPSTTPSLKRSLILSKVARITLVLPAPGDAMILTLKTRAASSAARFCAASRSLADRICSATVTRVVTIAPLGQARHPARPSLAAWLKYVALHRRRYARSRSLHG